MNILLALDFRIPVGAPIAVLDFSDLLGVHPHLVVIPGNSGPGPKLALEYGGRAFFVVIVFRYGIDLIAVEHLPHGGIWLHLKEMVHRSLYIVVVGSVGNHDVGISVAEKNYIQSVTVCACRLEFLPDSVLGIIG